MKSTRWMPLFLLAAFLLPIGARYLWFNRGSYQSPEIPTVDPAQIAPAVVEHQPYVDQPTVGAGRVVFDLSKDNNLEVDDLAPLRERLAARGVELSNYDGFEQTLQSQLIGATALVVAAPSIAYSPEEIAAVRLFVQDGGRLLLVADPTRPVPLYDDLDIFAIFYAVSATPAVNSLANQFGIVYNSDYLYNIVENDGNYRNVRLVPAEAADDLTRGVEQVVFFAAHSLHSDGEPVLVGDEQTQSNLRLGEQALTPAVLAAQGAVLALGDITFLTPPYNTQGDNDRFLSNLADWLAQDTRQWSLQDFPYLFQQPVDVVQTFAEVLEPGLIAAAGPLQDTFTRADLAAGLRQEPIAGHDVLFLSTFAELEELEEILAAAQVTIHPSTEPVDDADLSTGDEGSGQAAIEIQVEGFGTFAAQGSSLFLVDQAADRTTLAVLAEDAAALGLALQRLSVNDFYGCAAYEALMICSNTGETNFDPDLEGDGANGGAPLGRIFILAADAGQGVLNSAYDMQAILSEVGYEVTIWSQYVDGLPDSTSISGYDVYILDAGDYPWDSNLSAAVDFMFTVNGSVLITGEQLSDTGEFGLLNDLQVLNADHPLAQGFTQDEVITLFASASGVPANVLDPGEDATIVFTRGASSELPGAPALVVLEQLSYRYVVGAFAFYRLPPEALRVLLLNAIEWLTFNS